MSQLEMHFLEKLGDQWQDATPGFCLQAYSGGKKVADIEVGETYPYYDLASLTKIIFTVSRFMFLFDEKAFKLNDRVSKWVEFFPEPSKVQVRDLLTHSGGLTWWYPFYKTIAKKTDNRTSPEEAWRVFLSVLSEQLEKDFEKKPFDRKSKSVYSDLDFYLLGATLEAITGRTLYDNWLEHVDRLGLKETDFHRGNKPKYAKKNYAPTEDDQEWRKKTLQGEVHDQNTYALKGVATHAGLFGPISDVSRFGLLVRGAIRDELKGIGRRRAFASGETTRLFTKRSIPKARGDWALGFMMPTKGSASCGDLFSAESIGHTGFTGTSIWYDPKQDLLISILSNRVHPTAENKRFAQLRPLLHTWIVEGLSQGSTVRSSGRSSVRSTSAAEKERGRLYKG